MYAFRTNATVTHMGASPAGRTLSFSDSRFEHLFGGVIATCAAGSDGKHRCFVTTAAAGASVFDPTVIMHDLVRATNTLKDEGVDGSLVFRSITHERPGIFCTVPGMPASLFALNSGNT